MQTLIELYDERLIENYLGPETFRPERVVYLCPPEVAHSRGQREVISSFLARRGLAAETLFLETSLYKTDRIVELLRHTAEQYPGCALDVTGGTDAALVAAGIFSGESDIPVFTWSRKKNRFFSIQNADFADGVPCTLSYSVEDFIRMTGGRLRTGRADQDALLKSRAIYAPFFGLYLRYRHQWSSIITYLQRASQPGEANAQLTVSAPHRVKGEHGSIVTVNADFLHDAERIGLIHDLAISETTVSFRFDNLHVRTWMRDPGSVLELYVYNICHAAGIFEDVVLSAVVDWEQQEQVSREDVTNEIDVVATRGIIPLFISCKTCDIKTEALNELAILAERFGGKGAKAAIVTTALCSSAVRHRAAQLGIAVVDREELTDKALTARLRTIMKLPAEASEETKAEN